MLKLHYLYFRSPNSSSCLLLCCQTVCMFHFFSSPDTLLSHVEQLLRAFILKISVCDAVLNNNPPGNNYCVTWQNTMQMFCTIITFFKFLAFLKPTVKYFCLWSQVVHLQSLYIPEKLPHATWRRSRWLRWDLHNTAITCTGNTLHSTFSLSV